MQTIGRTNNGGFLVEMSDAEHRTFKTLEASVLGLTSGFWLSCDFASMPLDTPLDHAFTTIAVWADLRFRVNDLRHLIVKLDERLYSED